MTAQGKITATDICLRHETGPATEQTENMPRPAIAVGQVWLSDKGDRFPVVRTEEDGRFGVNERGVRCELLAPIWTLESDAPPAAVEAPASSPAVPFVSSWATYTDPGKVTV